MARSWFIKEARTSWITGFPIEILPETLHRGIRVIIKKNSIGFEVEGIVGSIPLLNGDTLHIIPKVGTCNFIRMMLTADGLYEESRRIFKELASYSIGQDRTEALIARAFVEQLRVIASQSVQFSRVRTQVFASTGQGRINIPVTRHRWALRKSEPFACTIRVRDDDLPQNRVLAAAAHVAVRYLPSKFLGEVEQNLLKRWNARSVQQPLELDDIDTVKDGLRRGRYTGARGYYKNAVTIALMLLGVDGLTQGKADEIRGESFIIQSATVFERYVRVIIGNHFRAKGYTVTKGGKITEFLYVEREKPMEPDVMIYRGNKLLCLADAKYKEADSKDHYQLFTYLTNYGVTNGFFVSPVFGPASEKPLNTLSGKIVRTLYLPLDDLDQTEIFLGKKLDAMRL